ncbi:MAG: cation:proton antiporter [Chitinispirillales bacterium]|jgi:Kef-type K+ transport system membrane component KefB/mannitol/fructose-specific phosphotransferase system IIA component (Ntr-type)|nr:cation:proton antiporter [Chitinispirillales bacterium]
MSDQLFVFSILLFAIFSVPIISEKTKIPGIVFYILFGIILESFVFKLESLSESFHIFSEIGKLYLMFIAGLEIDTFLFKKNAFKSVVFGLLTFIIPQLLGTILIVKLFGCTPKTAILTASFFASHTLLSLRMINKFGLGNSEAVSVTVGATIISDIAVLGLLAVISDISQEITTFTHFALMFISWILFIVLVLWIIPKITQKIFRAVSEDGYSQFLFVFASVCLVSWSAHFLRLESLIGAFFCGLAFGKLILKNGVLMTKINFAGNTLFIPFFLISAGMLIRPKIFVESNEALVLGIALTVLTIISKSSASFIFGKIFKYSKEAIFMMSGMTFQQAATTIACAVVGLEIKIISETIFNAAMILILLTCTVGEIAALYFAEKYAQNLPKKRIDAFFESRTLVLVSDVESSGGLLDFACLFRTQAKKYMISPLTISDGSRQSLAESETILGFCMNHASELEENFQAEMRIANNTIDGILHAVAETKSSTVVCPFERGYLRLLDDCSSSLVFAKIVGNIAITKRIIAVFMPTSENSGDVVSFIAQIKHLSIQVSAEAVFYLSENQSGEVSEKINKFFKGAVKYKICVKKHWNIIKRDLPGDIRNDDALVVLMGARHKLFRSPSTDKYPVQLSDRFERNNVFAVYPSLSLVALENEEMLLEENVTPQKIPEYPKLEAIETQKNDFESITRSISEKNGVSQSEIYNILFSSLELYPVELIPEVILIHAHTEYIENPQIFLWFQKEKREIYPSKASPKVLIVVLNPLNGDPQIHLKTLSRIAGLFTNPKCCEIIENCQTCEELTQELQKI